MILARYALKEHLAPFLLSFCVIMFLLVVDLILQKMDLILGKGVPAAVVLELFFLNTAWMVALAVPMAVLVASLMAFGRLSADHEIVAMRGLGVGVYQVFLPVLIAAVVLGGLLVVFNDRVLPEFNYRGRLLMGDIQRKRPTVALEGRTGILIQDFDNFKILIGGIDEQTSHLKDLVIYKYEPGGYPTTIVAAEGQVQFTTQTDEALLVLKHGEIHRVDEKDPAIYLHAHFEKQVLRLGDAGRQFSRTASTYRSDRELGLGAMQERVDRSRAEADDRRTAALQRVGVFCRRLLIENNLGSRPYVDFFDFAAQMQADAAIADHKYRQADRYLVEIHKKLSIPVACVVFVLVGAPLGIRTRGNNPAIGAGISIGFFLLWWLCLIGGETLADRGHVAPWLAMWFPNLFLVLAGGWLSVQTVFEQVPWPFGRRGESCGS
ncbi:MAG: LptF/LptG family permease [bacterium]|nr:LptF/LptG family permease [bacterium]